MAAKQTDNELIAAAKNGNTSAFSELVRRYEELVYGFSFKVCRDREKAEETLQDTFVNVYRKLRSFDGRSKFSTWLYSIVTNNCLMKRRQRRSDSLTDSLDASNKGLLLATIPHDSHTPIERLMQKELREVLDEAILRLPLTYRVVFVLRDMEGKSTEETAAIMKITGEAVKSRLRRARAFLREQLLPYVTDEGKV